MKTIEESCIDYCDKLNSVYNEKEVYKAGAEFAQRWIPVTESLPENHPELILDKVEDRILNTSYFHTKKVLAKFPDGSIELIQRFGTNIDSMLWAYRENPIEWRPIEYK